MLYISIGIADLREAYYSSPEFTGQGFDDWLSLAIDHLGFPNLVSDCVKINTIFQIEHNDVLNELYRLVMDTYTTAMHNVVDIYRGFVRVVGDVALFGLEVSY